MTAETDASGSLVAKREYTDFGTAGLSETQSGTHESLAWYANREYDPDVELVYMNYRWYDQKIGSYTTEDPIGSGENWYQYVGSRPMTSLDPWGLADVDNGTYRGDTTEGGEADNDSVADKGQAKDPKDGKEKSEHINGQGGHYENRYSTQKTSYNTYATQLEGRVWVPDPESKYDSHTASVAPSTDTVEAVAGGGLPGSGAGIGGPNSDPEERPDRDSGSSLSSAVDNGASLVDAVIKATNKDYGADQLRDAGDALGRGAIGDAIQYGVAAGVEAATDVLNAGVQRATGFDPVGAINTAARIAKVIKSLGKQSFTKANFRPNLVKLTGRNPWDSDAHHIFPQKVSLQQKFLQRGINIHDPHFGTWWESIDHRSSSKAWNNEWEDFFGKNPSATQAEIFAQGRSMAAEYGLSVYF